MTVALASVVEVSLTSTTGGGFSTRGFLAFDGGQMAPEVPTRITYSAFAVIVPKEESKQRHSDNRLIFMISKEMAGFEAENERR